MNRNADSVVCCVPFQLTRRLFRSSVRTMLLLDRSVPRIAGKSSPLSLRITSARASSSAEMQSGQLISCPKKRRMISRVSVLKISVFRVYPKPEKLKPVRSIPNKPWIVQSDALCSDTIAPGGQMKYTFTPHEDAWLPVGPLFAGGKADGYRVGGMPDGKTARIPSVLHAITSTSSTTLTTRR